METNSNISVAGRIEELNNVERGYPFRGGKFKRGNSWEYCHKAFSSYVEKSLSDSDYDYLALQLAFYLASWGMYRGSSFLLELDYKIHIPAIKMMMEDRYENLFSIENPFVDQETAQQYEKLMFGEDGIYKALQDYYLDVHTSITQQRREDDEKKPNQTKKVRYDPTRESDTLLTKILLGVYGCIPAYDRYFKDGIGFFGKQKSLNVDGKAVCKGKKALRTLLQDCKLQKDLDTYWQKNKDKYTFMKVVDMYFFSLGTLLDEGIEKKKLEEQICQYYSIK